MHWTKKNWGMMEFIIVGCLLFFRIGRVSSYLVQKLGAGVSDWEELVGL